MGSEQSSANSSRNQSLNRKNNASTDSPSKSAPKLTRGHTIAVPGASGQADISPSAHSITNESLRSGNNSPGASVCSDPDLPYISYTVNRPIGDSPKMSARSGTAQNAKGKTERKMAAVTALQRRQMSLQAYTSRKQPASGKAHNIVVVKEGKSGPQAEADEDMVRLQKIPMFLPIMRGTLGLPGARDPEVLEGLDYGPWLRLASRFKTHIATCAQIVATEQAVLTAKIKEVDAEIHRHIQAMTERQRKNARNAERLSRVHEISHQLNRCNSLLTQTVESVETLNRLLPPEDQLEPFVWSPAASQPSKKLP